MTLMGVGVRTVFLGFHAYSAGVYIEEECLHSPEALTNMQGIDFSYVIRIVPTRKVSLAHIRGALGRALEKMVSELPAERQELVRAEIREFLGCFPTAQIEMHQELIIARAADGSVSVQRLGHEPLSARGQWLGSALFRVYMDETKSALPELCADYKDSINSLREPK